MQEVDTNGRRPFADVLYHWYVEIERMRSKNLKKITHAGDD